MPAKPPSRAADKKPPAGLGAYGARINQLFQDAIRDLEDMKQPPPRPTPARGRA